MVFNHRSVATIAAKPNGACLFNSMSLLLCGTDMYSLIIRHVICNYISEPQNYCKLQQHIPPQYSQHIPPQNSSGKDYVEKKNMWNSFVWGMDLEVYVFCLITGHDVYVYGNHFDPILTSLKW